MDEGNPIVRWVIHYGPHPIGSLFMMKAFAVAMAIVCVYRHREGLLRKVNVCFAVVVLYNLREGLLRKVNVCFAVVVLWS